MVEIKEITPAEAIEILKNKNAVLLDVRTEEEYRAEHIKGSVWIPLHELEERIDELKGKEIIILCLCRSGNRSRIACEILKNYGFKNLYNVSGGIIEWKNSNFEIVGENVEF